MNTNDYAIDFTTDSLMARQIALESEMVGLGERRYWDRITKAQEKGMEMGTAYGSQLTREAIGPLREKLDQFLADNEAGKAKRGRPNAALKFLRLFDDMNVVAFLTAKFAMNGITRRNSMSKVAMSIGRALEDELQFTKFAEDAPGFWKWLQENTKTNTEGHKRIVFRVAHREAENSVWDGWSDKDRLHLGTTCLSMFIEATGLVEAVTTTVGKRRETSLVPTAATMEWIRGKNDHMAVLQPVFMPTLVEPKDWTRPYGGGYYNPAIKPQRFIKTRNRNLIEELKNRQEQMQPVYDAVNAIQRTPWKVNAPVFEVMTQLWENDSTLGGIPQRTEIACRPHPFPEVPTKAMTEEQLAEHKAWKREKHAAHTEEVRLKSKRLMFARIVAIAGRFAEEERFFFPYQLDFRGRVYAMPMFLNPQGNDAAKGLLTFADGDAIETEEQADWLAIHGANVFGYDKADLNSRAIWAHMNTEQVMRVVDDPYSNTWWTEADKPWQFLAWCFEWAGFMREGYGYKSSLPIAMDGSCNGLQHFSAMLLDSEGGRAVNLLPSDKPSDIYADVAQKTIAKLEHQDDELAAKWLQWGIGRKDTKRSVMIVPYSGTLFACKEYIEERMVERISEGEDNLWGDKQERGKAAMYLAKLVWASIDETVVAARGAMNWLQGVAKQLSKEGLPINWTTPDGFVVHQAYPNLESYQVRTKMGDKYILVNLVKELPELKKSKQASGVSPNFVHSMDATALRMTVNAAVSKGMHQFAMIHDSYGTTAARTPELAQCLREEFVRLYQEHDILEEFRQEVGEMLEEELPTTPPKGDLEIEDVLESAFFFA